MGGIVYQASGASVLWIGCPVLGAMLAAAYLGLGLAAKKSTARKGGA